MFSLDFFQCACVLKYKNIKNIKHFIVLCGSDFYKWCKKNGCVPPLYSLSNPDSDYPTKVIVSSNLFSQLIAHYHELPPPVLENYSVFSLCV